MLDYAFGVIYPFRSYALMVFRWAVATPPFYDSF